MVVATSVTDARERLGDTSPSVMLLAAPVGDETAAPIDDVPAGRFGHPGLPIVAVLDGDRERAVALGVDETVAAPVTGDEIVSALERAALLDRYTVAIDDFFDACRTRAERESGVEPSLAARRDAGEVLAELQAKDASVPFEILIEDA